MKKYIIILLALYSQESYSQKIEDKLVDKFDSTYTISTKAETLVGKLKGKTFLYVKGSFFWLRQAKFANLQDAKGFTILLGFKTDIVTSIDEGTEIKIEFADGTIGTYSRPSAKHQIVTEIGLINFDVPLEDKLFTTDIKAIRVRTSEINLDYEIPTKNASIIKNALALVKSESEKPL